MYLFCSLNPLSTHGMMEHMEAWVEIDMHMVDKHAHAHMHKHTSTHVDDDHDADEHGDHTSE